VLSEKSTNKQRLYILDPLRLVAAFAVVFYHYLPFVKNTSLGAFLAPFKFGYLGVIFFFMLSGFVIMASCQNRSAFQFALARALRIYPAFIACLFLTVIILYLCAGITLPPLQIISNALIVNDYIGQPNIDGVYWTLQAELKFYACIFILSLCGLIKYWRVWLSVWLLAAISHHFLNQPFFLGWFIRPAYSFYFIGGVSAYLLSKEQDNKFALLLFFVALAFSCLKSFYQTSGFVESANLLDSIVAASVVLVFFVFFFFLAMGKIQTPKKSYWILMGAISYPLYLMHNRAGKTLVNFFNDSVNIYYAIIFTLLIILLVSLFIHLFVEKVVFRFFNSRQ